MTTIDHCFEDQRKATGGPKISLITMARRKACGLLSSAAILRELEATAAP
jgi:hypothetical protein